MPSGVSDASTVDNSVMPGIGRRKDGWPNRDLDVGAIIALEVTVIVGIGSRERQDAG